MIVICDDESYIEAAEFYGEKLKLPEGTLVGIKLYDGLNVAGYCERHDDEAIPYYIIGLDVSQQYDEENPFSVLAHEMVHIRQYATNELIDEGTYCIWMGKKFTEFEPNTDAYFL